MTYFVEDDRDIRGLVVYTLGSTGFETLGCEDDKVFHARMAETHPELVLLDIMLPGIDDIQILRRLEADRSTADTPTIMVTARGTELGKIKPLDLDADDYMTRPFGMMELVSQVQAVLRRSSRSTQDSVEEEILTSGPISLNLSRRAAMVNGGTVTLILKEYRLLEELMTQLEFIFSRDQLLDSIWGYSFHGGTRAMDVHIRTLRKKLGEIAKCIKTVRGVRYKVSSQGS